MAGIGFELRQHLREETYAGMLRAYVVAGIVGSGPWVISISSMLLVGLLSTRLNLEPELITPFLATVTYLMATSLTFSGMLQLVFVRFIADRLFEKKEEDVAPNLIGALVIAMSGSAVLGGFVAGFTFTGHLAFRIFLTSAFVILCSVWILSVLLSGVKAYRAVVGVFGLGYGLTVIVALALSRFGLGGYIAGFVFGHGVMLFAMLILVLRRYPSKRLIAFDFFDRKRIFPELIVTGGLLNAAVWVDKFVFWMNPVTSEPVIGPIRYSVVYDVPIFVAYLSVIPGMAVFFVRIETEFAEQYDRFYEAVRQGDTLDELYRLRVALVSAAKSGIYDVFRIQGLTVVVLLLVGQRLLALFGIPAFYSYLFNVDVVGVAFQVVLLAALTVLFYLDCRKVVLYLSGFFAVGNLVFSIITQQLGPRFYGFGFLGAAGITSLLALAVLSRRLERLDYETFMS